MRRLFVSLLGAVFLLNTAPAPAASASPIVAFTAQNPTAVSGQAVQFQAAVTPDAAPWEAGSFSVVVQVSDAGHAIIAQSPLTGGDAGIAAGQTAVITIKMTLASLNPGTYSARAVLRHNGAVADTSEAVDFAVNAQQAAPPVAAPTEPANTLDGNIAFSHNFAQEMTQTAALALNGKYPGGSWTASGSLSSVPGGGQPVLAVTSPAAVFELGTFSPSLDPLTFDGVSGSAIALTHAYGERHKLVMALLSGARGTLNPIGVGAISYASALGNPNTMLTLTHGYMNVAGDPDGGSTVPFVDYGNFLSAGIAHADPRTSFTYGLHYSLINYTDKNTLQRRNEHALSLSAAATTGSLGWTLEILRASALYPNLTAPGIQTDRQTERLSVAFPLGSVHGSLSLDGYNDDLPGAGLPLHTHYWNQSLNLSSTLRNHDALGFTFTGGSQHQGANPDFPDAISAANATDATTFTYSGRRGTIDFSSTLGYSNQHDVAGNAQHSTQNGLTLGRTVQRGLSIATAVNVTTSVSSSPLSTNSVFSEALTLNYARDNWSLSSALSGARTRPYGGQRPPDTSTFNFGAAYKISRNAALQFNLTQVTTGPTATMQGSLNVTQQF